MTEFSREQKKIAAFFDLDGTLTTGPSLEWSYFQALRKQKKITAGNYLRWMREAVRLVPRGIIQMRHANKMYLRGVPAGSLDLAPEFLKQALDQVAWHARQEHLIVIVSGTIETLAERAADFLEVELLRRGIDSRVRVFATQLEEREAQWTGRIIGDAIIGKAKAKYVRTLASELNLNLARCYAYGDSIHDLPMLAAVGRPATVNAAPALHDVARRNGWPAISWKIKFAGKQRSSQILPAGQKRVAVAERWA